MPASNPAERGLAGTGGANQRESLPGSHDQVDPHQHVVAAAVGEVHTAQLDLVVPRSRGGGDGGSARRGHRGEALDPGEGRTAALQLLEQVQDRLQGLGELS